MAAALRDRLNHLDDDMERLDSHIGDFNRYVNRLVISLENRGEYPMDLLPYLFKGYKKASNAIFVKYIEKIQHHYNDGWNITSNSLMDSAKHKWRNMVEEGIYNEDSARITALGPGENKGGPNKKKKDKKPEPEWMTTAPPEGQTTETINGSEWIWCTTHLAWGKHTTAVCEKRLSAEAKPTPKSDGKLDGKSIKISKALAAIANADDSDSA
jgi:hypothetical protein